MLAAMYANTPEKQDLVISRFHAVHAVMLSRCLECPCESVFIRGLFFSVVWVPLPRTPTRGNVAQPPGSSFLERESPRQNRTKPRGRGTHGHLVQGLNSGPWPVEYSWPARPYNPLARLEFRGRTTVQTDL